MVMILPQIDDSGHRFREPGLSAVPSRGSIKHTTVPRRPAGAMFPGTRSRHLAAAAASIRHLPTQPDKEYSTGVLAGPRLRRDYTATRNPEFCGSRRVPAPSTNHRSIGTYAETGGRNSRLRAPATIFICSGPSGFLLRRPAPGCWQARP